ncbi:MAG: CBS domain-containing protein [Bythopirellula sp.]|nr:CBS domain-containing protein [Bythopirellula sp.]
MIATADRLKSLKVYDAMAHSLITVSANSTMSEAADVLCEHRITGAPVVDERGKCVGIISGSDFIHCKAEELDGSRTRHMLVGGSPYGAFCIEEVQHDLVRNHMTPSVKTIQESTALLQAARCMCHEHIHRLIVVDESARPVGILTSLDLVATLIAVVEE